MEYDSTPTLATPKLEGYTFTGWTYNGNAVSGKWTIAENVTLVAGWTKNLEKFTITFRQNGQTDKVYTDIVEGSTFTEIPETADKVGYTVEWDECDLAALTNISGNVIVEAIETVKTYTIILNANGGTVSSNTITVTYGEAYELLIPSSNEYDFEYWSYNGREISMTGIWTIDSETETIELSAKWGATYWTDMY